MKCDNERLTIVAQMQKDTVMPYAKYGDCIPVVIMSNFKEYPVGTRFDYGFLQVALEEGVTVLLLPSGVNSAR